MPADPDTLSRDYQPSRVAGMTGRTGEAPELPILLRIPQIAAAMQQKSEARRGPEPAALEPREFPEPGSIGDANKAPFAARTGAFEASTTGSYGTPAAGTYDEHVQLAGVGYADAPTAGEKSWTEQVGSKLVLALVLLAIGGVALVATQGGPNIGDLPELSGDVYGAVEEGAVASAAGNSRDRSTASPIEPSEDVYGKFNFGKTDGVEPVAIGGAKAGTTTRQDAPSIAQTNNSGSSDTPQDDAKSSSKRPTVPLAGPSGTGTEDLSAASADDIDAVAWPDPEPVVPAVENYPDNVATASGGFGEYESGASADRASRPSAAAGDPLNGGAVTEPTASDVEPAETYAPLATATAGPIDWTQFDPHNRRSHYEPAAAGHAPGHDLLARNPAAAGYGGTGKPQRAAPAPHSGFAAGQQYHSVGFEGSQPEAATGAATASGYGLPPEIRNSQYGSQQPGNQLGSPYDAGYAYPGRAAIAAGPQSGHFSAPAGQPSGPANGAAYGGYGSQSHQSATGYGQYGAGGQAGLQHPAAMNAGAMPPRGYGVAPQPGAQPSGRFTGPYGASSEYGTPSAYPPQQ